MAYIFGLKQATKMGLSLLHSPLTALSIRVNKSSCTSLCWLIQTLFKQNNHDGMLNFSTASQISTCNSRLFTARTWNKPYWMQHYFTLFQRIQMRIKFSSWTQFYPICFNTILWEIRILLKRQVFAQQVAIIRVSVFGGFFRFILFI